MAKEKKSTQQPSRKGDGQRINRSWDTPSRPITPTPSDSVPPDIPAKPQPAPACGYTGETTTCTKACEIIRYTGESLHIPRDKK